MSAGHLPSRYTLFESKRNGDVYRIPSLLYLKEHKTFLAFAEKRASARDVDARILVMRRGKLIKGSVNWEEPVPLEMIKLRGYRTMNPCPVYERKCGVIYLFFLFIKNGVSESQQICEGKNHTRLCYVLSRDAGISWGKLTDLTHSVLSNQINKWATFGVGPGHGVQTQQGKLIVPAYAYIIKRRYRLIPTWFFTQPHSFYLYSDDGGDSWKVAEPITEYQTLECEIAEITTTDNYQLLYCNARTKCCCRVEALSLNLGHFEIARLATGLSETKGGCQGSVVSFHPPKSIGMKSDRPNPLVKTSWLMYTHPTGESCCFFRKHNRTNLGIYINQMPLKPKHWHGPWIIENGPSGYSDLACLDETETFACLYECGVTDFWE
ncbi:sialidase-3-like [Mustelus asterias]